MKKLIVFFFSISVFAQDYGNNAETLKLCTTLQTNSFSSNLDADSALDRILDVVGLSKNFVLAPCSDINNAVAVSFKGVRYILYDPDFMSMLSRNTSNWTNLFILAHEVGHHVNGHSLDLLLYAGEIVDAPELKKKRNQELEADEFAGFVLAKLGASLNQTTSSVSIVPNEDDTYSTHPKRDKRINSIKNGWNRGKPKNTKTLPPIIQKRTTSTTHSDWKTLTEYPSKKIKESNNPFEAEKKFDPKIEVIRTSTVEGKLIDDNSKNWNEKKTKGRDFSKPYFRVTQTIEKDKSRENKFFIQLPDIEYIYHHRESDVIIDFDVFIDDTKFNFASPRLWRNQYQPEWISYEFDNEGPGWVNIYCKNRTKKDVINFLKNGKKLFVKIKSVRLDITARRKHPSSEYCTSECFNVYEFSLSGSSKALSF